MRQTSTAEKQLKGIYKKCRDTAKGTHELLTKAPPDPVDLESEHARELWQRLAIILTDSEILTEGDLPALELLCETHQIRKGEVDAFGY